MLYRLMWIMRICVMVDLGDRLRFFYIIGKLSVCVLLAYNVCQMEEFLAKIIMQK